MRFGVKEICEQIDVPKPYLSKILQELVRNNILSSTKGPNGGFGIEQPLEQINMHQIIVVFEGEDHFNKCLIKNHTCSGKSHDENHECCALHKRFKGLSTNLEKFYKETRLSDIVEDIDNEADYLF